jgi:hypothetical protein
MAMLKSLHISEEGEGQKIHGTKDAKRVTMTGEDMSFKLQARDHLAMA